MAEVHPLLREKKVFMSVGVWDALSALLAQRAGFDSVFLSGYAVAGATLGLPDFGMMTQTEVLDAARRVIAAVDLPVIVDGDTGHGGVLNVQRMVRELVAMGAAGVILEDQVWPKRCGHMADKQVVSLEEHVAKITAAREAIGDSRLMIVGRTDAIAPLGLDEAIRRGNAYARAGADLVFVEAPETVEDMKRIVAEIDAPLTLNMIDGGKTPRLSLEQVHELGFVSVGYVLTALFSATAAMSRAFQHLREQGTSEGLDDSMVGFDEFTSLVGLQECYETDRRFRKGEKA